MFKKLKSIFKSEKDDTQKDSVEAVDLPAESADQAVVTADAAETETITAAPTQPVTSDAPTDVAETAIVEQEAVIELETPASPAEEIDVVTVAPVEPMIETVESVVAAEESVAEVIAEPEAIAEAAPAPEPKQKTGFFGRIKAGLSRTKGNLTEGLGNLFLGAKEIDDDLFEEIETQLLLADVGVEATTEIIDKLTARVSRKQLANADALYTALKEELAGLLDQVEQPIDFSQSKGPFVLLMVGVNGVGKTTTIGKLAKKYQAEGKSVMLAAGDTFRAAAVEQLQVWGDRNNVPVVAQHTGADSASVIYDALQSAQAKNIDVLIADTAGRLQNKDHLMQELEKVVRVMKKLDPDAPHEVMLVLDAGTGQNAMSQAKLFKEAVGVSGLSLTKLDGTAKGGIIFAIAKQLDLPIRYIGVGEQVDDLRPFKAKEFVSALFD
ncbi:signal recognition particle-docking protein FtsY [Amphritea sp. 2_MG-2023]|uniref:signal recognition particle-docking protein FtsY n=1 Tax=Amphritea TaxID=515417 RepID=UPI001C06F0BF|nr:MULTISPECIES: signal recognition particle-docking protein FtsY [Amphritea]MBU2964727.1 signal recognition particle-docking protein FtsY [Amphritea atlantica]MDO6417124.1 signal recognition particle-docking protein FtsY [Amphritea sp. 2_MG-2023]